MYQIPPRSSQSMQKLLLRGLRVVITPVARQVSFLFTLFLATAFIPLIVIVYTLYAALVIVLVALPQFAYTRLTGRRVEWAERVLPFGRTLKMSPDQLKKRNLIDRD